jgi:hypothetical protein
MASNAGNGEIILHFRARGHNFAMSAYMKPDRMRAALEAGVIERFPGFLRRNPLRSGKRARKMFGRRDPARLPALG